MRTGQAVNLNDEVKLSILNSRIERYTIVEIAKEKGWASDADAVYNKAVIERKVMMEEYQRRFIYDRVQVTMPDLRDLFQRFNTSLRASHLHARTRAEADSLHTLLKNGASFEQLAAQRFKSTDLATSGGDLGYFTVDEMDIAFEAKAYSMKVGDISEPVSTSTGYSIIKLTDRITVPVLTETQFAEKIEDLRPLALEQKRELATRADMAHHIGRFAFDESVIRTLWAEVQKNPAVYTRQQPELTELPIQVTDALRNRTIAKSGVFNFTVGQWMQEAWLTSAERRATATTYSDFLEQVEAMAYRSFALDVVTHHPQYDAEYVKGSVDETFYSYLFERFEAQMDKDVTVAEADIRQEWQRNASAYVKPLEFNFAELMLTDSTQAARVASQLRGGADFVSLLKRFGLNMESKAADGELGYIPIDHFGAIQPRLLDARPGDILGPFQLDVNRFVVFRCLGRRDSRPMTFGEAVPVIRERLHQNRKQSLRAAVIAEGRNRYNATIHFDKLQSLTFEL
jgi:parvulin-like peptidyl-prolyl isomerase